MDSLYLGSSKPVTGLNPVYEPDNGDFKKMLEKIMKMNKKKKERKRKSSEKERKRDVHKKRDSQKEKVHDKINDNITDEGKEKEFFNKKDVLEKDIHDMENGEEKKKDVNTIKNLKGKDLNGSKEIVELKEVNHQRKAQNEEIKVLDRQVINNEKEGNADTNVIREVTHEKNVSDLNTDFGSLLIALPLVTDEVKLTQDSQPILKPSLENQPILKPSLENQPIHKPSLENQPIHKPSPEKKGSSLNLFQFSIKTDATFLQYSGHPIEKDTLVKNAEATEKIKLEKKNRIKVRNPEMEGCRGKVENHGEDIHPGLDIVMDTQPKTAESFWMKPKPKNGERFEMETQPMNEERYEIETHPKYVEIIQIDAEPKNVEMIEMKAQPKNLERYEMKAQSKNEERPQEPSDLAELKNRLQTSKNLEIKNKGKCISLFQSLVKSNKEKKRKRSPEKYPKSADFSKFKVPKLLRKIDPRSAKSSVRGSNVSGSLKLSGSNLDPLGSQPKVPATLGFGASFTMGSSSKRPVKPSATVVSGSASATEVSGSASATVVSGLASSLDPSSWAHLLQVWVKN